MHKKTQINMFVVGISRCFYIESILLSVFLELKHLWSFVQDDAPKGDGEALLRMFGTGDFGHIRQGILKQYPQFKKVTLPEYDITPQNFSGWAQKVRRELGLPILLPLHKTTEVVLGDMLSLLDAEKLDTESFVFMYSPFVSTKTACCNNECNCPPNCRADD